MSPRLKLKSPQRKSTRPPGRPALSSSLPRPVSGQPFSLLAMLRRTVGLLTVADCAELLGCTRQTIYEAINKAKIPEVIIPGIDGKRVDPAAWALLIEHDNPHLKPSARKYLEACP